MLDPFQGNINVNCMTGINYFGENDFEWKENEVGFSCLGIGTRVEDEGISEFFTLSKCLFIEVTP